MVEWDQEAARAYGRLGRQAHLDVLVPVVDELLGDLRGRTVLDFGCGPGHFSVELAGRGARRVLALDANPEMVRSAIDTLAAQPDAVRGRIDVRPAAESVLPLREPVDAVLCSLALMMCGTRDRLERTVDGLLASMTGDGVAVLAVTHPCFRNEPYGSFRYVMPEGWRYWDAGDEYDVVLTPGGGGEAVLTDVHWRVEDYVTAVVRAGGVVDGLRELPAAFGDGGRPAGPPAYLVLRVRRR